MIGILRNDNQEAVYDLIVYALRRYNITTFSS